MPIPHSEEKGNAMNINAEIWNSPIAHLVARQPDHPVHYFAPSVLQAQAQRFIDGFNGLVTFAVKANPDRAVLVNLLNAGITGFDVASPNEIKMLRELAPDAALHYNNPVRSRTEIRFAHENGVRSFSIDGMREFVKLAEIVPADGVEISVRFRLPVEGAKYDFGSKFGASSDEAVDLLRRVKDSGFIPSITFHPGTQCEDPQAWHSYITEAARIATKGNVTLNRLNVGGGFPCHYNDNTPELERFFTLIDKTVSEVFPRNRPALVCEPGRAMVASAFSHATRVKSINDSEEVYLNDGIYGGLSEFPVLDVSRAFSVISPTGKWRNAGHAPVTVFGPTCDSLDVLPEKLSLPADIQDDDYILFQSMGAYVNGVTTDFNGYGQLETVTVLSL